LFQFFRIVIYIDAIVEKKVDKVLKINLKKSLDLWEEGSSGIKE